MNKPSPANTRSSTFRNWARDITEGVKRKRDRRENVDLNGELARAMERAYRQGFEDAQTDKNPLGRAVSTASSKKPLDPRDPTPLSRDDISDKIFKAYYNICTGKWSRPENWNGKAEIAFYTQKELSYSPGKQPPWDLVSQYGSNYGNDHAHRTIVQLVKLGLLQ